jgi:vacuolar-type H+-ATPase subunit I/STV1
MRHLGYKIAYTLIVSTVFGILLLIFYHILAFALHIFFNIFLPTPLEYFMELAIAPLLQ